VGREVKRVPLDFEWPVGTVWEGFQNPYYKNHCSQCPSCSGFGITLARQRLEDLVCLLMLSSNDVMGGEVHPYFVQAPLHRTQGLVASPDIVELTGGLAGRPHKLPLGHDALDRHSAIEKIIAAAGLDKSWGICKICEGEGSLWDDPQNKTLAENWRQWEPPNGDGYQMWETVSEGSPVSPVFTTPEELADWMCKNDTTVTKGTTWDQWVRFIKVPDWAPSTTLKK